MHISPTNMTIWGLNLGSMYCRWVWYTVKFYATLQPCENRSNTVSSRYRSSTTGRSRQTLRSSTLSLSERTLHSSNLGRYGWTLGSSTLSRTGRHCVYPQQKGAQQELHRMNTDHFRYAFRINKLLNQAGNSVASIRFGTNEALVFTGPEPVQQLQCQLHLKLTPPMRSGVAMYCLLSLAEPIPRMMHVYVWTWGSGELIHWSLGDVVIFSKL